MVIQARKWSSASKNRTSQISIRLQIKRKMRHLLKATLEECKLSKDLAAGSRPKRDSPGSLLPSLKETSLTEMTERIESGRAGRLILGLGQSPVISETTRSEAQSAKMT